MRLFVVLGLVLLAVLILGVLLWRLESRHAGQAPSWRGVALPLLVVVVAGLGYLIFGMNRDAPSWVAEQHGYAAAAQRIIDGQGPSASDEELSAAVLVRVLQSKLVRQPSEPGWYTLGLLYDQLGAPGRAEKAARRALQMDPDDVAARLLLARGLIEQAGGKLTDDAQREIDAVLAVRPDHDGAWILQAMAAWRAHRYDLAVTSWQHLLQRHGDGETGTLIRQRLAQAKQQQALGAKLDGLTVQVLGGGQPVGGTLFVFLREKGQGGQPLAARRILVEQFPVTVTLRASDWLHNYPDDLRGLRVAARYTPAPGSSVAEAGVHSAGPARPLRLDERPAAILKLAAQAGKTKGS